MKTLENKNNLLLSRQEVKVMVEAEKTPSLGEANKMLSDEFKKSEDLIVVEHIKGKFGMREFLIQAKIYDSKEKREEIEPKKKPKKAGEKQEKENAEIKQEKKEQEVKG